MKWRSIILPVLIVIILGGLASFVTFLYLSQYPALLASGEDAYNILRDVIMIVIAVLTLFTAILIAVISWALRNILLHDLKYELGEIIEESKNNLCSNLHSKITPLWGRLYEYHKDDTYLIDYAIEEARKAISYANNLDEKKYWDLKISAINNYLMALADKGDVGDTNQAYKLSTDLEQILKTHGKEIRAHDKQSWQETIYFVRARLPRTKTNDREQATRDFNSLREHPDFEEWYQRWDGFGLITKDANPDKSS